MVHRLRQFIERAGTLIGALLVVFAAIGVARPLWAAADFPTPAGMAEYSVGLAEAAPNVSAFSGSFSFVWDLSCETMDVESAMKLAFSLANNQSITIEVDERSSEKRNGDWFTFETSVSQQGDLVRQSRGTITRAPGGGLILNLVEPQQGQVALPGNLLFSMSRTQSLIDAARDGADRFNALAFLPASVAIYEVRSRIRPAGAISDHATHSGDALTPGPAWEIAETFVPQGGQAQPGGGQAVVMGLDMIPVRMSLALSGLSLDVKLSRFVRGTAKCP